MDRSRVVFHFSLLYLPLSPFVPSPHARIHLPPFFVEFVDFFQKLVLTSFFFFACMGRRGVGVWVLFFLLDRFGLLGDLLLLLSPSSPLPSLNPTSHLKTSKKKLFYVCTPFSSCSRSSLTWFKVQASPVSTWGEISERM